MADHTAAAAAILIIAGAVLGFLWQPASEMFYVQTVVFVGGSSHRALRRDRIAVKAELARLWLLFLPTIIAVGFLLNHFRQRRWLVGYFLECKTYPAISGERRCLRALAIRCVSRRGYFVAIGMARRTLGIAECRRLQREVTQERWPQDVLRIPRPIR
jgi:hypothetical protein